MDKELIEHIATQLNAHAEPYAEGAWERFSVQEEKKRRGFILWPLWSAAALILLSMGLYFGLADTAIKTDHTLIKHKNAIKKSPLKSSDNTNLKEPFLAVNQSLGKKPAAILSNAKHQKLTLVEDAKAVPVPSEDVVSASSIVARNENHLENTLSNNLLNSSYNQTKFSGIIEKKKPVSKVSFEEILAQDSKKQPTFLAKNKSESKWEPGVYVAPAMGNDNKVNINYGFSLAYNVAKKLSISSGIAYSALSSTALSGSATQSSAAADVSPLSMIYANSSQSSTSKNLESVQAKLGGINIPLELRYSFSSKFYTGIGVSAFAILNSKQQNNYVLNQFESRAVTNAMGISEQKTLIVQEKATEIIPESSIDANKYIGFYNFSLGYKQKISAKKNISVEPFLRLPMKTFSNENLNLTNGGLRLKLDF